MSYSTEKKFQFELTLVHINGRRHIPGGKVLIECVSIPEHYGTGK